MMDSGFGQQCQAILPDCTGDNADRVSRAPIRWDEAAVGWAFVAGDLVPTTNAFYDPPDATAAAVVAREPTRSRGETGATSLPARADCAVCLRDQAEHQAVLRECYPRQSSLPLWPPARSIQGQSLTSHFQLPGSLPQHLHGRPRTKHSARPASNYSCPLRPDCAGNSSAVRQL